MHPKRTVVEMDLPDYTHVLEETEQVIRQCFAKYQLEEVFLSFNGGKDCTVLLDVTINILKNIYQRDVAKNLKVVYIRTKGPFREIENFVKEIEDYYGVKLIVTEGEMKSTLQRLLEEDGRLKACLMGTRRTDPYSENLNFMQKTDPSWPQIVRVLPFLNWSYHHVWSYILRNNVPYCTLYNEGTADRLTVRLEFSGDCCLWVFAKPVASRTRYCPVRVQEFGSLMPEHNTRYTSIGSTTNTWPNPSLAYRDCHGCISYLPAWKLTDGSLERAGRGTAPKQAINGHVAHQNHTLNGSGCT